MMKKLQMGIFLAVLCCLCSFIWTPAEMNAKTKAVSINSSNFTDKILRRKLSKKFDKNHDGVLSVKEIKQIKSINLSTPSLKRQNLNIKGISKLKYITKLNLDTFAKIIGIKEIKKLNKLSTLYIYADNRKLDTRKNKRLKKIGLEMPYLNKIYVNSKVENISISYTNLKKLRLMIMISCYLST